MKVNLLYLLCFGIILQCVNSIIFGFDIHPGTMKCMGEYLTESTLGKIII